MEPAGPPVDHYDDLAAEEIISLLGSLEPADLDTLLRYERDHRSREAVVGAHRVGAVARRRASHGRLSAKLAQRRLQGGEADGKATDTSLHFLVASSTG